MNGLKRESQVKDEYGNRKRGDSWEGRITVIQQQISLYDIDNERLENRKYDLKEKSEKLLDMRESYKRIAGSVQYISIEYYQKLRIESENLYHDIIKIANLKKGTKFLDKVEQIYSEIKNVLIILMGKNPEIEQKINDRKVKDWFYEWLWRYKHGHVAKTTFKGYYGKTKNHIIETFGNRYLTDIKPIEIQRFINDLMIDYEPSTIKQIYLLLDEGYRRAVKDNIIKKSPVIDIEIPPVISNTMMAVNIELEKKLINIFKDDEMCFPFAVLIDTGLRTSELCGLKWKNIDFKKKILYVRQSYQRVNNYDYINGEIVKIGSSLEETPLKSRTSKRAVPMSKGVNKILKDIFNENIKRFGKVNSNSFVFINTKGNPIVADCLHNRLYDLLERNHLKGVSLHRFRHTFATRLYEAKVRIKNIQLLLGHSTVQMTERYLHIDEEEQYNAIEQMEEYCGQKGICI